MVYRTLEPDEGRILQWLVSEYQRQVRGPRVLDEVEMQLRLRRGRLRELLHHGALAEIVRLSSGKCGERVWLTSDGYAEALNVLAALPRRH